MSKKKRLGECCPIMTMVLERDTATLKPAGFEVATMWHMNGKPSREALTYRFAKAKKGSEGEYGAKSQFADTTYAPIEFCPWCGERVSTKRELVPAPAGDGEKETKGGGG